LAQHLDGERGKSRAAFRALRGGKKKKEVGLLLEVAADPWGGKDREKGKLKRCSASLRLGEGKRGKGKGKSVLYAILIPMPH